ncbi:MULTISPECIES: dihydrofolate reductase family protein [unclassified Microbacterium]|uniref:dihydrofolate reductase family protein n=1 Tax=unclassified Microbacterium TaxID=2609290 RepID=UPI000EA8B521|nr:MULTISPECIES: dihydrofolate reductase family protein [unclassified Microbacterium]MBT2485924.1 dihydrofolate reductase family protein [Microbacterium sp. ISL-108]RKN68676.1 deaminase [Microbacterium sp. CGR2]
MSKVLIHATVSLDGFMADENGGVDWMNDVSAVPEDEDLVAGVVESLGAVVGGANKTQTIEEGEIPYGGILGAPVFLMTHSPHEPVERDGTTYHFVVDDVAEAVTAAKRVAGDKWVSVLGGSVSRQCLEKGLIDEIVLHVVPILLGSGISLFTGLSEHITLERVHTSAFASEVHLRYRVLA